MAQRTQPLLTMLASIGMLVAIGMLAAACSDDSSGERSLAEGECRESEDCEVGASCSPGGSADVPVCGACPGDSCMDDTTCDPGTICEVAVPANCPNCPEVNTCIPVCTTGSCSSGSTCNDMTGRCEASVCTADDDCPLAFECVGGRCAEIACGTNDDCRGGYVCAGSTCVERQCQVTEDCSAQFDCANGICERRTCDSDDQCDNEGWCVATRCWDEAGTCQFPVP